MKTFIYLFWGAEEGGNSISSSSCLTPFELIQRHGRTRPEVGHTWASHVNNFTKSALASAQTNHPSTPGLSTPFSSHSTCCPSFPSPAHDNNSQGQRQQRDGKMSRTHIHQLHASQTLATIYVRQMHQCQAAGPTNRGTASAPISRRVQQASSRDICMHCNGWKEPPQDEISLIIALWRRCLFLALFFFFSSLSLRHVAFVGTVPFVGHGLSAVIRTWRFVL